MVMKLKISLPRWLMDPELFWMKMSAGLFVLSMILLILCIRFSRESSEFERQAEQLAKLTNHQRELISGIGLKLDKLLSETNTLSKKTEKYFEVEKEESQTERQQSLACDLNHDGIVDWKDFDVFSKTWGSEGEHPSDFNHDSKVNEDDFNLLAGEWLQTESWYHGEESQTPSNSELTYNR
jgi:hypothetical protein